MTRPAVMETQTINLLVDFAASSEENESWLEVRFEDGEIWRVSSARMQEVLKGFVRTYGMLKVV